MEIVIYYDTDSGRSYDTFVSILIELTMNVMNCFLKRGNYEKMFEKFTL